jgi:small redox-active disulfide protein 2
MDVKILGTGCANCQTLERLTNEALTSLGIVAAVDHVTDEQEILSYGVMSTPALVIDDDVVLVGRVPGPDRVRAVIAAAAG